MKAGAIEREVLPDGTVVLRAGPGTFRYGRPGPGVLQISVHGDDDGQFGSALVDEIANVLARDKPLEIFVDASGGSMPGLGVTGQWVRFFSDNHNDITAVHILVGSRSAELTLALARRLTPAGRLISLYTRREAFEARRQGAR